MALASDGVSIGSPDDMPVVVFSDYLCPYCAVLDSSLSNVMQSEASNIRVVYRQFPIESIHPTAKTSARAALCAASFGWFEQVHDKLFGRLLQTDQDLQQLASDSGVEDVEQLLECVASERSAQRVEDDIRTGVRIGVVATPSLIINGRLIRGVIPRDSLESLVAIAP